MARRPSPVRVGPLRCRVDARRRLPDAPDLWYWRVFYRDKTVWSGWETERGVTTIAARLVAEDNFIPHTEGKPQTVGHLLRVWAAHYRQRKDIDPLTLDIKRRNLRHLLDHFDEIELQELDHVDIDDYRDARLEEGGAPSTIEVEHRTLGQAWRWGRKRGFTQGALPPLEVERWSVYNARTPTDEEADAVIEKLRERATRRVNGAQWPWLFTLIEKETGARLREVGTLVWRRVHLDVGPDEKPKMTLLGKRTRRKRRRRKEHQVRTIPISKHLANELRLWAMRVGHRSPDSAVLGVKHKTCRSRGIWHIKQACAELGIEPFTNHGLRRGAIRRFRRKNVHVNEAAEYFGHSAITMMRIYDEIEPADLDRAIEKVYGSSE